MTMLRFPDHSLKNFRSRSRSIEGEIQGAQRLTFETAQRWDVETSEEAGVEMIHPFFEGGEYVLPFCTPVSAGMQHQSALS